MLWHVATDVQSDPAVAAGGEFGEFNKVAFGVAGLADGIGVGSGCVTMVGGFRGWEDAFSLTMMFGGAGDCDMLGCRWVGCDMLGCR